MILLIFLSGMVVSILLDWYFYSCAKNGMEIESYPKHYLKSNAYQLIRSWVCWSVVWPVVLTMVIVSKLINMVKK